MQSLDFGWNVTLGDPQDAQNPGFDDGGWRDVNLPHDWSIEGPYDRNAPTGGSGGYLPMGGGWYRKHFSLSASAREGRVWIEFDSVYENRGVWINSHNLGTHP